MPTQAQRQHVLLFRKQLVRKRMLRWAKPGAIYVPFIGDGDLAVNLYTDRHIYGADIEARRVRTANQRLPGNEIVEADCSEWPFPECTEQFAMADFDAYAHPYPAFEAFWQNARKLDRLVLFFTDGHRQAILRLGIWVHPDGYTERLDNVYEKQPVNYFYLTKHVWPWFEDYISQGNKPYRVVERMLYSRQTVTYWAAAIERTKDAK